MMLNKEIKTKE